MLPLFFLFGSVYHFPFHYSVTLALSLSLIYSQSSQLNFLAIRLASHSLFLLFSFFRAVSCTHRPTDSLPQSSRCPLSTKSNCTQCQLPVGPCECVWTLDFAGSSVQSALSQSVILRLFWCTAATAALAVLSFVSFSTTTTITATSVNFTFMSV